MRTPHELLRDFVSVGALVAWKDGKPALSGSVPDALILEIREQRAEFLAAWDEHDAVARAGKGYGVVPDLRAGEHLRRVAPGWSSAEYRRVDRWARKQPDQVVAWVLGRAEAYLVCGSEKWTDRDRMQAALADLWQWQLGSQSDRPGQVLLFLDQCVEATA